MDGVIASILLLLGVQNADTSATTIPTPVGGGVAHPDGGGLPTTDPGVPPSPTKN